MFIDPFMSQCDNIEKYHERIACLNTDLAKLEKIKSKIQEIQFLKANHRPLASQDLQQKHKEHAPNYGIENKKEENPDKKSNDTQDNN